MPQWVWGSVEERVEELEGGCCCFECKMRIADIARKHRQDIVKRTVESLQEETRDLDVRLGTIDR